MIRFCKTIWKAPKKDKKGNKLNGIELYIYTHIKIHTLISQLAQDFSHQRGEKTAIDENEEYVTNYCRVVATYVAFEESSPGRVNKIYRI